MRARRWANPSSCAASALHGRGRLADDAFHAVARARKGRRAQNNRIAAELTTTFASSHSKQVSLSEASAAAVTAYAKRATAQVPGLPNQRS